MYRQLEHYESEAFANWCRAHSLRFTHIANERRCSIGEGAKLKRLGVCRGVPDFMVFIDKEQSNEDRSLLIFIEMKRKRKILPSGKVSKKDFSTEEQREWINSLREVRDVEAVICYGSCEAESVINSYLR